MGLMQLMVQLGLNATAYETGLKRAKSSATEFGGHLSSAVGNKITEVFGAVAIEESIRKTIEYGGKVQDLSNRLGISTDAVQQWDHALQLNGSSIETAAGFFEKLSINREKALRGGDEQIDAFRRLGVSIEDLKSKRVEDIAANIARAFEAGDPQALISSLREVGGKGAGELVAAFRDGLAESLKDAPLISPENIANLDAAGDRMKQFGATWQSIFGQVLGYILPVFDVLNNMLRLDISAFFGALEGALNGIQKFDLAHPIKSVQQLVATTIENTRGAANLTAGRIAKEEKEGADKAERLKNRKPLDLEEEQSNKARQAEKKAEQEAVAEATKVLRLREQIAETRRKSALDSMRDGEKEKELTLEIAELKAKAKQMYESGAKESDVLEVMKDAFSREADLEKLKKTDKERATKLLSKPEHNSLQDIGNFLGGTPDRAIADKLDLLHTDLQKLITQGKDGAPAGITFPSA